MKNKESFGILAIPFLTICGGIYHLTYWAKFGINGLSIISIADIIKSSIYPFVTTFIFAIIGMTIGEFLPPTRNTFPSSGGRDTKVGKVLNQPISISILILIWLTLVILLSIYGNSDRWVIWALVFSILPYTVLDRSTLWENAFDKHSSRLWAIRILVFLPVLSFATGKTESEKIERNEEFQYCLKPDLNIKLDLKSNSDTLKLLGITEYFTYFTDTNNEEIYMVRTGQLDELVLKRKK